MNLGRIMAIGMFWYVQDIFAYRRGAHGARPAAYFSHAFNRWVWRVRSATTATFATAATASAAAEPPLLLLQPLLHLLLRLFQLLLLQLLILLPRLISQ